MMGIKNDKIDQFKCTTIVKDPSMQGGGIAAVALPLHTELEAAFGISNLVCAIEPDKKIKNSLSVGRGVFGALCIPKSAIGDLVHIHGIWTPFEFFSVLLAKRQGAKVIISPHGALEPWAFHSKGFKKKFAWHLYQKQILASADLLIVNSEQERNNLRALGLDGAIAVISNGVVLDGYNRVAATNIERDKVVLYFSRLDRKKGIELLVRSWKSLENRQGYKLHVQGYGDDAYKHSLQSLVSKLGLNEDVKFIEPSFAEQRWSAFSNASIYILPSYSENFGITVAEALFSGLPSITTTEMPWGELPIKKIGWSVECNQEKIAQALHEAISLDKDELINMRLSAIEYAESRFLWTNIAKEYEQVYRWALHPSVDIMPKSITIN
ncbi:glycosyltransferase [Vibrio makurazakiensis]|uniref:glycosyltransferase n=1 Tax=Vibrio makurazakiensis TaxID=2910250 RepID=UPI003D0F1E3C